MEPEKKLSASGPLQPLRPIEHQLIRARAINANAVTAPGVIMGNRAFVRTWEVLRSQNRHGNASHGK